MTPAMSPAARHKARIAALQALYQWTMTHDSPTEIVGQFLMHTSAKKMDRAYFEEIFHGVLHFRDELEKTFAPFLIDRTLSELDPIELNILRLSVFELLKKPDIPYRVVINEGLLLTKTFGASEGYKFVNGVLDKVARKLNLTS